VWLSVVSASDAVTVLQQYTPFAPNGGLRPGLRATPRFGGTCATASFVVSGPTVFRCFAADEIYDPCYLDARGGEAGRPVVVCVAAPWAVGAVRLRLSSVPIAASGVPPGGPPWALRLESGRRCLFVQGATSVVRGRRLNYVCDGRRLLFGTPDRTRPTWRISQATSPGGAQMRQVAIAVAWS
jgi:hypothetical protein